MNYGASLSSCSDGSSDSGTEQLHMVALGAAVPVPLPVSLPVPHPVSLSVPSPVSLPVPFPVPFPGSVAGGDTQL